MWRPSSDATPPARGWLIGLLFVVAALLAYSPAWQGEPVFDDHDHLMTPELQSLDGLGRIWTEFGVVSQYYPVFHTGLWLQGALWGHWMPGYHIVNILLHAACALIMFRLLRRLEVPGAVLAAAMFLLHPVMVESVAWISELKNTLSTAFYLAAALYYLRFDEMRRRGFYAAALVLFVAGLLSKSVVASLPAALLVVFWWRRGRLSWRKDARPLLPFFFAALAMGALTIWTEKRFIGATGDDFALSFGQRFLIAGRVVWFYLGKLAWPADLSFIYPRWRVDVSVAWQHVFPLGALAITGLAWRLRHWSRAPLAAWLLFVGTLFPALGFFNVYPFRFSFVADHYQYLACVGPFALAAGGAEWLARKCRCVRLAMAAGGAVLVGLAGLTFQQSALYRDPETLWSAAAELNPESFVVQGNLGYEHLRDGRLDESIRFSERAVALRPDYADAWVNLGVALRLQGRGEEAINSLEAALRHEPGLAAAHYNLALARLDVGREGEALASLREAVRLRPGFGLARNSLGQTLLRAGQFDQALVELQAARDLAPDDPDVHNNLGSLALAQGRLDEAITHLGNALRLAPAHADARYNLAIARERRGEVEEAVRHYQAALLERPALVEAHNNLALIYLREGRTEDALRHARAAVEKRPGFVLARYNLALCWGRSGRPLQALAELDRLLEISPEFAPALTLREQLISAHRFR